MPDREQLRRREREARPVDAEHAGREPRRHAQRAARVPVRVPEEQRHAPDLGERRRKREANEDTGGRNCRDADRNGDPACQPLSPEIWLVRHADAYDGGEDEPDPGLSAIGREQASRLAERLRRRPPVAIYSSPARRALETARAISSDPRVDGRLAEMTFEIEDGAFKFIETPDEVITRMSAATGGEAFFAKSWRDQQRAFAAIRRDVGHLYSLTYYPQANPNRGWRTIKVKLVGENTKKFHVRTRSGYRPRPAHDTGTAPN